MSKTYDNNMRGVLFTNDRKTADAQPDKKGQCEIDGVEYWVSGWFKESDKGTFMSLAFAKKDEAKPRTQPTPPPRAAPPPPRPPATEPPPDDIPF